MEPDIKIKADAGKHNNAKNKDDKKLNILILSLIGALLLFALLIYVNNKTGFIFKPKYVSYSYSNGQDKFDVWKVREQKYEGWQIKFYIGNDQTPYILDLRYDPLSLENIDIDRNIVNVVSDDKQIFITWDPGRGYTVTTTMAVLELVKVLPNSKLFHIATNTSFTEPYKNRTVKTCKDATKDSSVIYFKLANETRISLENDFCIVIEGKTEEDFVKAADRFDLFLLGIMR